MNRLTHAQAFRAAIPIDPFPGCVGELVPAGDGASAPRTPSRSPGRGGALVCRACLSRFGYVDGTIISAERGFRFRPRKGRRNS